MASVAPAQARVRLIGSDIRCAHGVACTLLFLRCLRSFDGSSAAAAKSSRVRPSSGMTRELVAVFAADDSPRVELRSCTTGMAMRRCGMWAVTAVLPRAKSPPSAGGRLPATPLVGGIVCVTASIFKNITYSVKLAVAGCVLKIRWG